MPGRISQLVSAFRRDRRGNAAISFGIVSIPGMIAIALLADYAAVSAARAGLEVSSGETAFVRALNFGTDNAVGRTASVTYIVSAAMAVATATISHRFGNIRRSATPSTDAASNFQSATQVGAKHLRR